MAGLLLAGGDFLEDDKLLARRGEMVVFLHRIEVAKSAIAAKVVNEAQAGVRVAVGPVQDLEDSIEKRRMAAKMAVARSMV